MEAAAAALEAAEYVALLVRKGKMTAAAMAV